MTILGLKIGIELIRYDDLDVKTDMGAVLDHLLDWIHNYEE